MAVVEAGWKCELLYQVQEEVLGTTFYFKTPSNPSLLAGTRVLAEAFAAAVPDIQEAFGSDVRFHCVKTAGIGETARWSYQVPLYLSGTAVTTAEDELCHLRLNLISEEFNGKVRRNRNQVSGIPDGDLTNGRVSNDVTTAWFNAIENWATGSIQQGGFQYFLAVGFKDEGVFKFGDVEAWSASPFAGTRIDRVKNRANTGRSVPVVPPPA